MSSRFPAPTAIVDDPKRPWKAVVALAIPVAIAVLQLVQTAVNDGTWTIEDTITVLIGALGAVAVYLVPNPKVIDPGVDATKTVGGNANGL